MSASRATGGLRRTFLVPGVLAIASLAGLVGGLLGAGVVDLIACAALATSIAAAAWALLVRRDARR